MDKSPIIKDIVLVGGGHAHVAVLKSFGMRPMKGVQITLVTRDVHTPYSGMLPGYISGFYDYDDCHVDLRPLARFCQARLVHSEVEGLDREKKLVFVKGRPPIAYDIVSIDIGSTPAQFGVPGVERAIPVKPIDGFWRRWEAMRERAIRSEMGRVFNVAVVGGGAGGVELCLSMQHRLETEREEKGLPESAAVRFCIVTRGTILADKNASAQSRFRRILKEREVDLREGCAVVSVEAEALELSDGSKVAYDECLWCTQAGTQKWIGDSGLAVEGGAGFLKIRDTLQAEGDDSVYGAGDCASCEKHPRPKAGVFAVRQGKPLADNIRRQIEGRAPRPFVPQRTFLSLISTGDKYAVATKGWFSFEAGWLWRLKDWIDRKWMRSYSSELPDMPLPKEKIPSAVRSSGPEALAMLSKAPMRCGGCGSKVGASVLSRVMSQLVVPTRPEVLVGLDAPDDGAVVEMPPGKVSVQTVDYFRSFIDDPFVFGAVAANHSLSDCHAMGAEPIAAMAVAVVPFGLESKVEATLLQMMSGACKALSEANCALVGGHTSEGGDLSLGFAVNGAIERELVLHKGGAQPGDVLIITKPVGTGALMAGDMRHKAKGRWVGAALEGMMQSNAKGAVCVRKHGATACTDVTGFGMLGHLVEMLRGSDVGSTIFLDAVPLLDGAMEMVRQGIMSSLQPANVRLARAVRNAKEAAGDERYPLLFDPQTAGGLLATVPIRNARACIEELRALGYERAAVVGEIASLPQDACVGPVMVDLDPPNDRPWM